MNLSSGPIALLFFPIFIASTSESGSKDKLIDVVMKGGATFIHVDVGGSELNPQLMCLDTGSKYTFLLNHKLIRDLPRARGWAQRPVGGIRESMMTPRSIASSDANRVNYGGFDGMIFEKWVRRWMSIGSHRWFQKIAVARIPASERDLWDPDETGLIGASPDSRFCSSNPIFGFSPGSSANNSSDSSSLKFFMSPIDPTWCRSGSVSTIPVDDTDRWVIRAEFKVGMDFVLNPDFQILIDSGTGLIGIPEWMYGTYRDYILSLGLPDLDYTSETGFPKIPCEFVSQYPPFVITSSNGVQITIPPEALTQAHSSGVCIIYIKKKRINQNNLTIGEPWFRSFVTAFDAREKEISVCEPIGSGDLSHVLKNATIVNKQGNGITRRNLTRIAGTKSGYYLLLMLQFVMSLLL